MARTTPPANRPQRPQLTIEEKHQAIVRINRRIAELEEFDPSTVTQRYGDPRIPALEAGIEAALQAAFGVNTPQYHRYSNATRLDNGPVFVQTDWMAARGGYGREDFVSYLAEGKAQAIALLQRAVAELAEEIEFSAPVGVDTRKPASAEPSAPSNKVFVVHGHDEGARETVARYLGALGFEPVILHEQASQGGSIIEKIEAHRDVGFAVVLLTPDDVGSAKGADSLEPRARQNVLLELGYFMGYLGRGRVCALKKGDVAIPSDYAGVVWVPLEAEGWKITLARELKAVGFEVDLNKAL